MLPLGGSKSKVKSVAAFYSTKFDKIYLRLDNDVIAIIHEANHALGTLYPWNMKMLRRYRGINEAATQSLTEKIAGVGIDWNYEYASNVFRLNAIESLLKIAGYNDLLEGSYYLNYSNLMGDVLDNIMGDGFYDKLVENMDLIDGLSEVKVHVSAWDRQQAIITVEAMIDSLRAKVSGGK